MAKAKSAKTMISQLKKIEGDLSSSRDRLRDMQSDIEELLNDKDEEIRSLDDLIDSLSKYV